VADGPALAWQAAVIARLKADAAVAVLVSGRVYDEPPQDAVFPYVRFGRAEVEIVPTDERTAWRITFGIEAHSRPVAGRVEATRLIDAVVAALEDSEVSVTGFGLAWCFFQTFTVDRANDGRSYVALAAFEAMLDAN
jgi:hypothetical protein